MKCFLLIILFSSRLFSQEIIMPVERKIELSRKDKGFEKYVFKDINNVFDKFVGRWLFKDDLFNINIEIHKQFDIDNRQDAIFINLIVIKDNDTLINTLPFNKPNYITGGVFENKNKLNKTIVFFSEISNVWQCGNCSQVDITFERGVLYWEIDDKQLRYNKTARLFPNKIKFTRL